MEDGIAGIKENKSLLILSQSVIIIGHNTVVYYTNMT